MSANRLLPIISAALLSAVSFANAETVVYLRFEEGADGAGSTGPVPAAIDTVVDSADGDDPFRTFSTATAPIYVTNVPSPTVPLTGAPNLLSLDFVSSDDIYTSIVGPLRTMTFSDITIEAYVQFDNVGGFRTIVGRDDTGNPGEAPGPQSLLYFQKGNDGYRVELAITDGSMLAVNTNILPAIGVWDHLAAVGNSSTGTLELFLNGSLIGSTTGYTGLFDPVADTIWTIGRGQYNGNNVDFLDGRIDEVRISSTALTPAQFLNVPEPGSALILLTGSAVLGLLRPRRRA